MAGRTAIRAPKLHLAPQCINEAKHTNLTAQQQLQVAMNFGGSSSEKKA